MKVIFDNDQEREHYKQIAFNDCKETDCEGCLFCTNQIDYEETIAKYFLENEVKDG